MSWFRRRAVPKEPPKLLPQRKRNPLPERNLNEDIHSNRENNTNFPNKNKERN
jgi:hypothetical protein